MSSENYSLLNKKLDGTSSLWKKKYTLLLKRCENVEKQNLRLINRLYQMKKITRRLNSEKKFLMHRSERYNDDFKGTRFYVDSELLPEGSSEYFIKKKLKKGNHQSSNIKLEGSTSPEKPLGLPPKKPMSAFFRYCQAQHLHMLKDNADISHEEIKTNLADKWSTMSNLEKEVYYESFEGECGNYEKGMNEFLTNFKNAAEESGVAHIKNEEEEHEEGEEAEEEELPQCNNIDVKKEDEFSDIDVKMEEATRDIHQQLTSSMSDEQLSNSSDEENEDDG